MSEDGLKRARYSNVERRLWNDDRFREELSPVPPCGQGLWLYLLTTPTLGALPGLIVNGEAAMAEHLRWPLDGFRAAFKELADKGMAEADWRARLVILPKVAINPAHRPESANVVRSWRPQWLEVPRCSLKLKYFQLLKDFTESFGPSFAAAFDEAISNPSANQIQIQIQTQKENVGSSPPGATSAHAAPTVREPDGSPMSPSSGNESNQPSLALAPTDPPRDAPRELWQAYLDGWERRVRGSRPPKFTDERRRLAKARLSLYSVDDLRLAIAGLWASDWHVENGHTSFDLALRDAKHVEQFMAKAPKPRPPKPPSAPADSRAGEPVKLASPAFMVAAMSRIGHGPPLANASPNRRPDGTAVAIALPPAKETP